MGSRRLLNLDTHIVVLALSKRLNADERRLLDSDFWCISDIVLWELSLLIQQGRIGMNFEHRGLRQLLREITIWPITVDICKSRLKLDFRSDPADEIIAATSLAHGVPLVTRDVRMLGSKVVPLAV